MRSGYTLSLRILVGLPRGGSNLIRELVVAFLAFSTGFLLAGIFAVDSYRKGYEDRKKEE